MSDFGKEKPTTFDDRLSIEEIQTREQFEKSKICYTCKWKDIYCGTSFCSLTGSGVTLNNTCKHWSK